MSENDLYKFISVFKDRNNHVLIFDIYYPLDRKLDLYYDLHLGKYIYVNSAREKNSLVELYDEQKDVACDIYMMWKWKHDRSLVIKKVNNHFPIYGQGIGIQNESPQKKEISTAVTSNFQDKYFIPKNQQPIDLEDTRLFEENRSQDEGRVASIKKIINQRRIACLIHFTPIANLPSILKHGLLSRKDVDNLPNQSSLRINDILRLDRCKEAVCLSICFPNYQMLSSYRFQDKENWDQWVVIKINPTVLWKYDCAFCVTNAASKESFVTPLEERKKASMLDAMFDKFLDVSRTDLKIPDNFPTNPQAEVLVFDSIPVSDFIKISFNNVGLLNAFLKENHIDQKSLFEVNPFYFSPRKDYQHWQSPQPDDSINDEHQDLGRF